ncbi:MAG: hypothetical protein ACYC91_01735 [Solirubrobacteraceae bacterium]
MTRGVDDGYHSRLVPGLKSSSEAERLAEELAFATERLDRFEHDPPGLYREVAGEGDLEERTWLAFLIAYLSPLASEEPFGTVSAVRTSWASGVLPALDGAELGPRSSHEPRRGTRTLEAYRAWAERAGTQAVAFTGDPAWTAERRFARAFERLALPGLTRDARFELLVSLGRLGIYGLRPDRLALGGENEVTIAAKRALGIADPMLLARRSEALAEVCSIPLDALDLGLYNWERATRFTGGLESGVEPRPEVVERARRALGL